MSDVTALTSGHLKQHTYVIIRGPNALVVDPDFETSSEIAELCTNCCSISVLLTHGHYDHVGGVSRLLTEFNHASVYIHEGDRRLLGQLPLFGLKFAKKKLDRIDLSSVDFLAGSQTTITCSGFDIDVHHMPGHTAGSVIYAIGDKLFTGDTIFDRAIGPTNLGGDETELKNSIRKCVDRKIFNFESTCFPGHGDRFLWGDFIGWWEKNSTEPKVFGINYANN